MKDKRITTIEVLPKGGVVLRDDTGGSELTYHDLFPDFIEADALANEDGTVRVRLVFDCHLDSRALPTAVEWSE